MTEACKPDENDLVCSTLKNIESSSLGVDELERSLRTSTEIREIGPLLVQGLSDLVAGDHPDPESICRLLRLLPVVCRPRELHMFCMEAWINLWSRQCGCTNATTSETCRLSLARAVVAETVVSVIARTDKGALFTNRENFLLSIGGQVLSKFFMPESAWPVHPISEEWLSVVEALTRAVISLNSDDRNDMHNQAHAEVAVRLVAGALECLAVRGSVSGFQRLVHLLLSDISSVSLVNSRMLSLDPSAIKELDDSKRSADFELSQTDVALIVFAATNCMEGKRSLIPLVWSDTRRADVHLRAVLVLLKSRFLQSGMKMSLSLLRERNPDLLSNNLAPEWMEMMLRIATSVGDESLLSLQERKEIFTTLATALEGTEDKTVVSLCTTVIGLSRVDAVVGLALKLLKDVWTKSRLSADIFHSTVKKIFTSDDYSVLDGLDSLKSVLNWARLLYLRDGMSESGAADVEFRSQLESLRRRVDRELAFIGKAPECDEREVKMTRVEFIGHLIARVLEIMHSSDTACCNHSHS